MCSRCNFIFGRGGVSGIGQGTVLEMYVNRKYICSHTPYNDSLQGEMRENELSCYGISSLAIKRKHRLVSVIEDDATSS